VDASEVTSRIVAAYEAGEIITSCAWCGRVNLDGGWVQVPREALRAINGHNILAHSICPDCAAYLAAHPVGPPRRGSTERVDGEDGASS
jgi:hypothetical protein